MYKTTPSPDMGVDPGSLDAGDRLRRLAQHCQSYKGANTRRSIVQLSVTALLFLSLIGTMIAAHHLALWWVIAVLALPAAGLLVRLFIVQHDCGHASYFSSRRANDMVGRVISLLTVTPYECWKRAHNIHHAASGNLDHRGAGAIDTLTVREYRALPWRKRFGYRFYRNPMVMFILGAPVQFMVIQRIPFLAPSPFFESHGATPTVQMWRSIVLLDIAMAAFYGAVAMVFGWQILLTVFVPVLVLTSWIGAWLFFVQHQFEESYWQPAGVWEFRSAALEGSSYYVLPPVLQWFTGNIGLHHIHHLCSAIPNYRLQECLDHSADLQGMNRMTLIDSLKCIRCALWDEDTQKMVGFGALKTRAA